MNLFCLQVFDKTQKKRLYIDPINGKSQSSIVEVWSSLFELLDKLRYTKLPYFCNTLTFNRTCPRCYFFCKVVDVKTGWDCSQWDSIEPAHFKQKDAFYCGVLVCVVSVLFVIKQLATM